MLRGGWRPVLASLGVATLTSILLAFASCNKLLELTPPSGTASPSDAGRASNDAQPSIAYGGPECLTCLDDHCAAQATACAASGACRTLESCLGACDGGAACRAACTFENITINAQAPGLEACLFSSCAAPCSLGCGVAAASLTPDAAAVCADCLTAQACSESAACETSPACLAVAQCFLTNHAEDRQEACRAAYDAGADAFTRLSNAVASSCTSQCAVGNQWYCVGHYAPQVQTNSSTLMTFTLLDAVTTRPLAGITASLCSDYTGLPCASQGEVEMSDEAGVVQVQAPGSIASAFSDGPTGFLQLSRSDIEYYYYWVFPLSEPAVAISVPVLTQSEMAAAAGSLHISLDSSRGLVGFAVVDCNFSDASGVQVTVSTADSETEIFYQDSTNVLLPSDAGTSSTGVGVAVNVPAGLFTITATPSALGRPSTSASGYAAAGAVTAFELLPNL